MFEFLRRKQVLPPRIVPEEAIHQKPYILKPTAIDISEGIYFIVYQNEFSNDRWCFGTSLEIAVVADQNNTLLYPVKREIIPFDGTYGDQNRFYIPQLDQMKGLTTPLTHASAGLIAEIFLSKDPESAVEHPTLMFETNLERVLWDSYTKKVSQSLRYLQ
ncbi:MAG: hypothetical protein Q7K45_01100 [Nanoarchaeota archaeon]|nr:hypothetical protein [Nanoarchaeota archaeon]